MNENSEIPVNSLAETENYTPGLPTNRMASARTILSLVR